MTTTGVVSVVSVAGGLEDGGNMMGEELEDVEGGGGGGGGGGGVKGSSTNLV